MTKDPICGITVDEATALRAERDGQTFYFCSEHCRKKFLAQPVVPSSKGGTSHSCCGEIAKNEHASHSDHAHHDHDGDAVKPSATAEYLCPMCPGVESNKPGDCPKCGMALERNPAWVSPQRAKSFTPARCTRKFNRIIQEIAQSVA